MNARIVEYAIAEGGNTTDIMESVNYYIRLGFVPHGSIVFDHCCRHVSDTAFTQYYAQPMVKYAEATQ